MADDVIKSFLVQLGFQVKKTEQKNMVDAVALIGKTAAGVVASLAALATAAAAATVAVANTFDKLYFVSQRTNTSVQNIRALSYAFSQVGGSSEQALGTVESFQKALRTNPGVGAFVRSLGVATEAGGKARDNFDVLMDSIDAIQKRTQGQQFAGAQLASLLGMDEQTYDMMLRFRKEVTANAEQYNKWSRTFGIDAKASAEASNQLMHGLRELSTIASLAGQRLLLELLPGLNSIKQAIVDWLNAHPELIEKIFRSIGDAAGWIGEKIKGAYAALEPFFSYLSDKATEMWQDGSFLRAWEKVATAFERVVAAIRGVLRWLNELDRATDMSSGLNAIKRFLGWVEKTTSGTVQSGLGTLGDIDRATDTGVGVPGGGRGGIYGRVRSAFRRRGGDGGDANVDLSATPGSRAAIAGRTFRSKAPGVMDRLMRDFNLNKEEAAIVLGNLGHESAGFTAFEEGGNGPGRGWAQWTDPGRKRRFYEYARRNGLDVRSDEANYGFLKWELQNTHRGSIRDLKGGRTTAEKMEAFERSFEGAGIKNYPSRYKYARDAMRAYDARGAASPEPGAPKTPPLNMTPGGFDVNRLSASPGGTQTNNVNTSRTIQQNNPVNVQVSGASDPGATGQAVESAVNRANERSLRNAQTAIR